MKTEMASIDFELQIDGDNKIHAKLIVPESVEKPTELEGRILSDDLTHETIKRLHRFIERQPSECAKIDIQVLGSYLFKALFGARATINGQDEYKTINGQDEYKTLGDYFTDFYGKFRELQKQKADPQRRFRVLLDFTAVKNENADYPWECLYHGSFKDGKFIGAEEDAVLLSRRLPEWLGDIEPRSCQLKVLLAWSWPRSIIGDRGVVEKFAALKGFLEGKNFKVDDIEDANWHTFMKKTISAENKDVPDIVHFIGHGRIYQEGREAKAQLAFTKTKEEIEQEAVETQTSEANVDDAKWINAADFAQLFKKNKPSLVVLHACEGARKPIAAREVFRSAAELVEMEDIPAVVAMQYEMLMGEGDVFFAKFYEMLSLGRSIDDAVRAGRNALGYTSIPFYGHPRFAMPVAYLSSKQVVLVAPKASQAHEVGETEAAISKSTPSRREGKSVAVASRPSDSAQRISGRAGRTSKDHFSES